MNRINLVLCVLAALQMSWIVSEKFFFNEEYRPRMTVKGDQLFPDADPAQIAGLTLKYASSETNLRREGDRWVVASEGNKPADDNLVQSAVGALSKLKPGSIISENPGKHADFDVEGENAIEVVATSSSGAVVARFILGKTTPNWRGVYVRYPIDSDDVMLVETNIRTSFDKSGGKRGAWRDKTIFKSDSKLVRSVEIVKPEESVVIERQLSESTEEGKQGQLLATDDDEWNLLQPVEGKLSRYTANSMASAVALLKADSFVDETKAPAELGLDPAEAEVTIKLAAGEPLVFRIGKEVDSKRYVQVPGQSDIYQVASFRLFDFLKKGEELLEKDDTLSAEEDAAELPGEQPLEEGPQLPVEGDGQTPPADSTDDSKPDAPDAPDAPTAPTEEPKQEPKQGSGGG